jgi:6-phosphogluconolactonase
VRALLLGALAACGSSHKAFDAPVMPRDATPAEAAVDAAVPTRLVAFASGGGPNIVAYEVDRTTGALTQLTSTVAFAATPSFLAFAPDARFVFALSESADRVGAFALDRATAALTYLDDVPSMVQGPAHIAVDRTGAWLFAAGYTDGKVAVFPIGADGHIGSARQVVSAGANAHELVLDPSNRWAFVPCLGSDYVAQYAFDVATGTLTPNAVPHLATAAGTGPRHLAFTHDGARAYLVGEVASTITMLTLDASTGQLASHQTLSLLPAPLAGNTGGEVVVDATGRFVWASNRGANTIAAFTAGSDGMLTYAGATSTAGTTPRNFTVTDATGTLALVANQGSSSLVPFTIDRTTGLFARASGAIVAQPSPEFVGVLALPVP